MSNVIFESLIEEANYAIRSKSRDLVFEVYGMAKMARLTHVITPEQFKKLNEMLITDGINNPKAGIE